MNKLTIITEKGAALKLNYPNTEQEAREQLMSAYKVAINKLAEYENTDLEPGELTKLKKENENLKRLLKSALDGFEYVDKYFGCAGCKENWEKCPFNGGEKDVCTDIWKHKEEIEEALKDE